MPDASGNQTLHDIVMRSLDGALGLLARRVAEPDFADAVRTAFGDGADRKLIAEYLAEVLLEKSGPAVTLVSADTLHGAYGAYDANTNTIFISREFVAQHAEEPAPIQRVLLEELGHAIDAKLNAVQGAADAPGDEGAIFAALIAGERLTQTELAALKAEDDHTTIEVNSAAAQVELAATYGTVTLDGALADWTAADRLDTAASGTAGYALYGKLTGNAYVFAIQSATVIAGDTTVWLNTDHNTNTGFKIWGWAGGAEYNINFDSAGLPKLFSGDAGQTLVNGTIDHSFSADRKTVEFAVPVSMLAGAPQAVDVLADVNEQVYLPNDYSVYTYTVSAQATGPAPVVGDVTLNGDLADWTAAQRLEVAGSGVAGYELYGKYVGDSYVFALKSTVGEIGAGTTFWLNTDQNKATGYQIWGFAGGAEYNVNFTSKPNLYSGAEGQTLVSNALQYAYSADKGIVEFAVAASLLQGAPKAVDVLVDVNNQVYLPTDYSSYTYTVAAPTAPGPSPVVGGMALDGSLADWTGAERIDLPGFQVPGYEIYGKLAGDHYIVAIKSDTVIGAGTTTWFNVDQNAATGHQIFGTSGGAEYNVNVGANKAVGLFTGDAGQTLVQGALQSGFSADGKVVEFAVAKSAMTGATGAVNVLVDVNDQTYLPVDYASQFTLRAGTITTPPAGNGDLKVAIVYSATTAAKYFDLTAYSQLFMAAQHQATMAGVPFDVLSEADLADAAKLSQYDAIVFPSFSHVPDGKLAQIETALTTAVYDHGVSLIAAGDFMTNDAAGNSLPGDSYARMKTLLGVTFSGFGTGDVSVHAADVTHQMMDGYQPNELIRDYTNAGYLHFAPVAGATVLANQTVGGQTYNAVLATKTGGDNIHFATDALLADNNLLWQAIQQVTKPEGAAIEVGLQMGRQASIVAARNDMDQSQETADVSPDSGPGIYDAMLPIIQQWKADYNFVGSYYINVGNNPPDQTTNWSVSKPYYQQMLAMGNEIGTHSYTHPDDTNLLSAAQIEFQFNQSQLVIEQQLGIDVVGAALPGNPEKIATATQIIQYFDYISGGASTFGAGYPGAFGYLTPALADKVYLAPNTSFDFTLAGWLKMTPEQADAAWAKEWAALTSHADVPVVLWPWHDYGPTEWIIDPPAGSLYSTEMYTNWIARAAAAGAEFVTLADLAQRIESFEKANASYTTSGNVVDAAITGTGLGKFALDIDGGQKIQKVAGWYAYDDDSVFTDRDGGQYQITLGATADDVTHITALPARGELLSVTGDGTNLSFSLIGEGKVIIDLKNPGTQQVQVQGAEIVSVVGERLELNLVGMGQHDVAVTFGAAPPPTAHAPVITSNGGTDSASVNVAENALAVTTVAATDQDGGALRYVISGGADKDAFTINETTGALAFKTAPDFEAPADAGGNNVYDIVVQAVDLGGLTDTQSLAVRVTDVAGVTRTGNGSANSLTGTGENDTLNGQGGSDTLSGLAGNDILIGGSGADTLNGGLGDDQIRCDGGNDRLVGGAGADTLTGGSGRDTFAYTAMEDFGTLAARDVIKDFVSTQDRLDLSAIDANSGVDGNQAFQFLSTQGAAFTAAGQLRFVHDAGANKTYVEGNVDADLGADFRIELDTLVPLKQTDVVL